MTPISPIKICVPPSIRFYPNPNYERLLSNAKKITELLDEDFFTLVGKKYNYLRQFIPAFLHTLPLNRNVETKGLCESIEIMRSMSENGKRKIPADAPTDFVNDEWDEYVFDDKGKIVKNITNSA